VIITNKSKIVNVASVMTPVLYIIEPKAVSGS